MITDTPRDGALVGGRCCLIGLTFDAQIHNVIAADRAIIDDDVPRPESHGIPFLHFERLLGCHARVCRQCVNALRSVIDGRHAARMYRDQSGTRRISKKPRQRASRRGSTNDSTLLLNADATVSVDMMKRTKNPLVDSQTGSEFWEKTDSLFRCGARKKSAQKYK